MTSPSQLRKQLRQLADEIPFLVKIAQDRTPLWRGLVHQARRKCGKFNCRCAHGERHVSTVLSDCSGEKQRNFTLTGPDLLLFTERTEEYRQVRQARARFVKVTRQMLDLFDQLEEIRRNAALRRYGGKLPPPRKKGPTS